MVLCYNKGMDEKLPSREIYGEQKLAEMVEFVTERLTPGPAYELMLEGVDVPIIAHKELEAYFNASLDKEYGAQISLFFDDLTGTFRLKKLRMKLSGQNGSAELLRAEALGFVPNFSINDQIFTKNDASIVSHEDGDNLLGRLGVESKPPVDDIVRYRAWRSDLLSSTKGWRLIEKVEIPTGLSRLDTPVPTDEGAVKATYTASTITISNVEILPSLDSELIKARKVSRSITLFDDEQSQAKQLDAAIEVTNEIGSRQVRLYNQAFLNQVNPFVVNDIEVTDLGIEPIVLDRDSFESFRSLIEEAIELKTAV